MNAPRKFRRNVMSVHLAAELFPPMAEAELRELDVSSAVGVYIINRKNADISASTAG